MPSEHRDWIFSMTSFRRGIAGLSEFSLTTKVNENTEGEGGATSHSLLRSSISGFSSSASDGGEHYWSWRSSFNGCMPYRRILFYLVTLYFVYWICFLLVASFFLLPPTPLVLRTDTLRNEWMRCFQPLVSPYENVVCIARGEEIDDWRFNYTVVSIRKEAGKEMEEEEILTNCSGFVGHSPTPLLSDRMSSMAMDIMREMFPLRSPHLVVCSFNDVEKGIFATRRMSFSSAEVAKMMMKFSSLAAAAAAIILDEIGLHVYEMRNTNYYSRSSSSDRSDSSSFNSSNSNDRLRTTSSSSSPSDNVVTYERSKKIESSSSRDLFFQVEENGLSFRKLSEAPASVKMEEELTSIGEEENEDDSNAVLIHLVHVGENPLCAKALWSLDSICATSRSARIRFHVLLPQDKQHVFRTSNFKQLFPFWERGCNLEYVEHWNISVYFENTPLESNREMLDLRASDDIFQKVVIADVLRLVILFKEGGVYVDTDVIALKDLSLLRNLLACENQSKKFNPDHCTVCNAVMAFTKTHPFLFHVLQEIRRMLTRTRLRKLAYYKWGTLGPKLLKEIVYRAMTSSYVGLSVTSSQIYEDRHFFLADNRTVMLCSYLSFFPIYWKGINALGHERFWNPALFDQKLLDSLMNENVYTVHLFGKAMADNKIKLMESLMANANSIMAKFHQSTCSVFCDLNILKVWAVESKNGFVCTWLNWLRSI